MTSTTESMGKKYGKQLAYLFDLDSTGFQIVESLAAELREDPTTIEKIIEREVSMHFLRQSERENDPTLVMVAVGNIWNSLYSSTTGEYEIVCERSINKFAPVKINNLKLNGIVLAGYIQPICMGLYLANPDESIFFCNKYSEERNKYGFYDVKSLDILYNGSETGERQPESLCSYVFDHMDKDSTRVISVSEIADMLSKRLNMSISDYDAKAQVVRSKLL
jgi:hypothetical protein